jgi:hypothetical protein
MFTSFNKLYKSKGMLVKNLYIRSFIDLFIFNATSIVNILKSGWERESVIHEYHIILF